MRLPYHALITVLVILLASCIPAKTPPPAPPAPLPVEQPNAGPYWHSSGKNVNLADALAYYTALKTLTSDELGREHERLIKEADSAPGNRLPPLQLVLLAVLPEQALVGQEKAIKLLETARLNADLHRDLADLFVLLGDQLSSRLTAQDHSKQESQSLRSTRKKFKTQSEALAACRQEREDLAAKLQKLQDIERSLMERERNK